MSHLEVTIDIKATALAHLEQLMLAEYKPTVGQERVAIEMDQP